MEQKSVIKRVGGTALAALILFLAVSLLTYSPADPPELLVFPSQQFCANWCGKMGAIVASVLFNCLGYAAYSLFPPLIAGFIFCWSERKLGQILLRTIGFLLILIGLCGLSVLFFRSWSPGPLIGPGGYLGVTVHSFLKPHLATTGSAIIYASFIVSGTLLSCDYSLLRVSLWAFGVYPLGDFIVRFFKGHGTIFTPEPIERPILSPLGRKLRKPVELKTEAAEEPEEEDKEEDCCKYEEEEWDAEEGENVEEAEEKPISTGITSWLKIRRPKVEQEEPKPEPVLREEDLDDIDSPGHEDLTQYELPSVDLLIEGTPYHFAEHEKTVQRQAKLLEKAFADFGFNIKVIEIQTGPVISQFEVQLERGLRLSKIMGLTDDLAIALKVPSVRIVAPIPGKNTVGVEVPNANRQIVRLREVMEETMDRTKTMAIPIFLGKDVAGGPMIIDMAKMPHLLIAGRTGTGKSVCLNSIIVSMLMTRRPDECRMIMIDPKMVELSPYKTIPHLMHPVVTDMKKAEAILAWAVDKMEQRYQILARAGVRQLSEYNKLTEEELYRRVKPESDEEWESMPRTLPYLVIIADEMADLMMTAAKEVETHIIRLAQKSRAVGIHLVLATQKPTVDIITGLIKSNLPARIAFEVASRTDSQVVLDRNGADKLLGNGDMLFLQPGTSQVLRGQGTYVSDNEINDLIEAVGTDNPDYITELVELQTEGEEASGAGGGKRDDLYNEAVEYVIQEGRGSGSLLQRKFKIGYGRASRLIEFMAEDGIVGPYNGSQAREVVLTLHEWRKRQNGSHSASEVEMDLSDERMIKTIHPKLVPVKPVPEEGATSLKKKQTSGFEPKIVEQIQDENEEEYEYVYEEWDGEEDDENAEYEYVEYEEEEPLETVAESESEEEEYDEEEEEEEEEENNEPPFEVDEEKQKKYAPLRMDSEESPLQRAARKLAEKSRKKRSPR